MGYFLVSPCQQLLADHQLVQQLGKQVEIQTHTWTSLQLSPWQHGNRQKENAVQSIH